MNAPLLWAEICLDALRHNIQALRQIVRPQTRLMAVVKADAYGHGAVAVARQALRCGADTLGVARLEEGAVLRKADIAAPILVLGPTAVSEIELLLRCGLRQTVHSLTYARQLSGAVSALGAQIKVHLKIDTGMGRIGLMAQDEQSVRQAVDSIEQIASLDGLEIEGIYTHFAQADSRDKSHTLSQFNRFQDIRQMLRAKGIDPPVAHAANSAAIIDLPETHLDMVRAGIAIYGLYPSDYVNHERVALQPVMSLKCRVTQIKAVPAGFQVSYGGTYITDSPTRIATIPLGYADGLNRLLSNQGRAIVRGQSARVAGRVCMDMTLLNVGHIPDVSEGDEVVVIGNQGQEHISADEVAGLLNTINYEIVTSITARVPRIYL